MKLKITILLLGFFITNVAIVSAGNPNADGYVCPPKPVCTTCGTFIVPKAPVIVTKPKVVKPKVQPQPVIITETVYVPVTVATENISIENNNDNHNDNSNTNSNTINITIN